MKQIKLFFLLAALLAFISPNRAHATIVLQESFEYAGCSFINLCVPGWMNTHGNALVDATQHTAGTHSARMSARYENFYCNPAKYTGDGIVLNFNFKPGFKYRITYDINSAFGTTDARWVVTKGLVNTNGDTVSCLPFTGNLLPAIPFGSQVLANNNFTNLIPAWHTGVVNEFTANADSKQLWMYCRNERHQPNHGASIETYIFVDNVIIEELCGPPVSSFNFQDSNGVVKTNFCLGEDVFLNGSASTNELGYWIKIQERLISAGPWAPFTGGILVTYSGDEWMHAELNTINLSQLLYLNTPSYKLTTDKEYKVVVGVYNDCTSWVASEHTFTVTCCTNFINPSFGLNSSYNGPSGYQIEAVNYNRYPFINTQHTWYVYSYSNPNGPFTPVTTFTSPNFIFNGSNMICYLVIHKVMTDCGEVCWGQTICNNNGLAGSMASSGGPYNGLIPNCVLPPVCQAPIQLGCVPIPSIFPNAKQLRWTNVAGALSYQLIRVYNDPACCNGTPTFTLPPVTVPANQILSYTSFDVEPDYLGSCFSWRIAVTCANGLTVLSPLQCFGPTHPCTWNGGSSGIGSQGRLANKTEATLSSYPNPVQNGTLIVSIQGIGENIKTDIRIYSMDGRALRSHSATGSKDETINVSSLPAGLYILKAYQNNQQVFVHKFEKQ